MVNAKARSLCFLKEDQIRHKKLSESTACSACFAKYCLRRGRGGRSANFNGTATETVEQSFWHRG